MKFFVFLHFLQNIKFFIKKIKNLINNYPWLKIVLEYVWFLVLLVFWILFLFFLFYGSFSFMDDINDLDLQDKAVFKGYMSEPDENYPDYLVEWSEQKKEEYKDLLAPDTVNFMRNCLLFQTAFYAVVIVYEIAIIILTPK